MSDRAAASIAAIRNLVILPIDALPMPPESAFNAIGRGLAIHWSTDTPSTGRRSKRPTRASTVREWRFQRLRFDMLRTDGDNRPPQTVDELEAMVRKAYVLVAGQHPIPSDARVYYEVTP